MREDSFGKSPLEEAAWGKREGFGRAAWDRGGKPVPPSDPPSGAAPRGGCRRPGEPAGRAAHRMAMAAEVTGVVAAASECGISQRPHPHLPSLGFCEGKQVGGAEREWRRGTARKGGREGGEKAREREEPGERDKADPGKREKETPAGGEPGRGEGIASEGPGGERKDRDCSQASDLLKDVERGQRLCPGPGDKAALAAERERAGAGPPGWCNSRGENGLCPTFLMPGGRAARL